MNDQQNLHGGIVPGTRVASADIPNTTGQRASVVKKLFPTERAETEVSFPFPDVVCRKLPVAGRNDSPGGVASLLRPAGIRFPSSRGGQT
jgi:hypothetical protein